MLFSGKRNPINVLFTVFIVLLFIAFKATSYPSTLLDSFFIFLFGFFVFGPQMLIGLAAVELSHSKAAATANGFVGCFAYLGAAVAGGPLGAITKVWGWESYLWTLALCGLMAVLLLLPLWSVKVNPEEPLLSEPDKAL